MSWRSRILPTIAISLAAGAHAAQARELTIANRVEAQKAIEQVYWSHRIWPAENPGPKPPLSAVLSDDAIRAKVEDYLKMSNALETVWQRPVTAAQLQAELDRMSRGTHDPGTLRELFAALGNDPFVIAETLGRQALVERLARHWYASDGRFHGALKQRLERELDTPLTLAQMKSLGGTYAEQTIVRGHGERHPRPDGAIELDDDAWRSRRDELAKRFGASDDGLAAQRVSPLEEDVDAYSIEAVKSISSDTIVLASVTWPKRSFDAWWAEERARNETRVPATDDSYTLRSPSVTACTDDTWQLKFYAPAGAYDITAVWTGSEMIEWVGGASAGRYDPSTDTWRTITGENAPAGRGASTAVWTGTEMIVWGGGNYLNTGGRYNPASDTWAPVAIDAGTPAGRWRHSAVWTGTEMIVWGGYNGTELNTGGRYNPSTDHWVATSVGANVPTPRQYHAAVWSGSVMVVWGGYSGNFTTLNTGGRYDPLTDSWTPTATAAAPFGRWGFTAVWTGTEMIVFGGVGNLTSGGRYNPVSNTWVPTSTNTEGRASHTAVWTGTVMIVWGGMTNASSFSNTGARYSPATNTWAATSTGANVPAPRILHVAVWTGSEMIVWGGETSNMGTSNFPSSGGRYNPTTNTWVPTSQGAGVPLRREDHTATWTGAEMFIWGGRPPDGEPPAPAYLNTGSRYVPATDTWTPTPTTGAPSGRRLHSAVWTGTELIVWGGFNGSVSVQSGGRFSPASNLWTATSTGAGVPSARSGHVAVWSGTEMIVWGGSGGGAYFNSGGRYAPATNSWSPTSIGVDTPAARSRFTGIWDGSELIVWGGYNGQELGKGGRYVPASDTWHFISGNGEPDPRDSHSAVWTGTKMIIWGGTNGSLLNTGASYDPSADQWTQQTAFVNAPSPRQDHTAVWTGKEMIVWGGAGPADLQTGGRYDPELDAWTATSTQGDVPSPRSTHTAVWTGDRMLIWGGEFIDANLSLYCAASCQTSAFYRDQDGDGYGNPAISQQTCAAPPGYVTDATDCNDADPAVHPGAVEVCNGIDDDCNSIVDDHAAPVEVAPVTASKAGATASYGWPPVAGATSYDVLRGRVGDWPVGSVPSTETCLGDDIAGTSVDDSDPLADGEGRWYLVRASNACGNSGYGSQESNGVPTVPRASTTCP